MKRLLLGFLLLLLVACTHLVWESTERLQIRNLSDRTIRNFSVVGESDTLVWIRKKSLPESFPLSMNGTLSGRSASSSKRMRTGTGLSSNWGKFALTAEANSRKFPEKTVSGF